MMQVDGSARWGNSLPRCNVRLQHGRRPRLGVRVLVVGLAFTLGFASSVARRAIAPSVPVRSLGAAGVTTAAPSLPWTTEEPAQPAAPEALPDVREPDLAEAVREQLAPDNGVTAAYVLDLGTGQEVALQADQRMPAASLFKVLVMVEVFRQQREGKLAWGTTMVVGPQHIVPGSGILQDALGRRVTVKELVELMMGLSDNVAAVMLMDLVGRANINATAQALGLHETLLHTYAPDDPLEPEADNCTSARDVGLLLQRLAQGEVVDPAASDEMIELMRHEQVNDWLEREVPLAQVAHKTGSLPHVRNDAGIITMPERPPIVLVVLTDAVRDHGLAEAMIGHVARTVMDHLQR
jgi:beta-lactamase class A